MCLVMNVVIGTLVLIGILVVLVPIGTLVVLVTTGILVVFVTTGTLVLDGITTVDLVEEPGDVKKHAYADLINNLIIQYKYISIKLLNQ